MYKASSWLNSQVSRFLLSTTTDSLSSQIIKTASQIIENIKLLEAAVYLSHVGQGWIQGGGGDSLGAKEPTLQSHSIIYTTK